MMKQKPLKDERDEQTGMQAKCRRQTSNEPDSVTVRLKTELLPECCIESFRPIDICGG